MTLIERRIGLVSLLFFALLSFAGLRALYLGTVRAGGLQHAANSQQVATFDVPAIRGTITDRDGVELAVSEPADDVTANPMLIKNPAAAARRLAPLLQRPVGELAQKLGDRSKGFVYLRRVVPGSRSRQVKKLGIDGIDLVPSSRRIYPQDWLASQLLGFVGIDGNGLSGLEYSNDMTLVGRAGRRRVVSDALGQPIQLRDLRAMRPGGSIQLTLDAAIQDRAEQVLADVGAAYSPKGAIAIVMDPNTTEILALANWPRVNANDPSGAPPYAKQDRAVQMAYEPGSTFKPFTVAGALEDHLVTPDTQFNLPSTLQVADRTIEEAHGGFGSLTTSGILARSSNIGSVLIGQKLGATRFDQWVRRFGFGRSTRSQLPGEEGGIILKVKDYSGSSMGNLPIGQGLAVTPLQMATAYSALANGGILRPARIVHAVDGKLTPMPRGRRVVSRTTSANIRRMLEGVFSPDGTASEVSIPGYQLAGKTGTAQKPDPKTGGYSDTKFVASFLGFAPARNPKLLVAVMVDEPQGVHLGGLVAAPAFGKIMQFALGYLGVPPS
jgi:cell division protein FtsI/penicillin-binding protein 2